MNSKFTLLLGLSLVLTICSPLAAEEEKKKLKLVFDKLEKVKDAEHIMSTELRFDKDGDSDEIHINGKVETAVDLDDNYRLTVDVLHSKEKEDEKKLVFRLKDKGVCDIMKVQYKNYFYGTLKEHCNNAPDPETCPVAKDKFEVKNYPFDSSKFSNYLLSGFYHFVCTLSHNNEEVLQYRFEAYTKEV